MMVPAPINGIPEVVADPQIRHNDMIVTTRHQKLGSIQVTMLTWPKNLEGSITILGEKGSVKIGGTAVNRIEQWLFAEWDDDDKLIEQGLILISDSFLDQIEPGSNAYNIPLALRLVGDLHIPALAAALTELVRRHAAPRPPQFRPAPL